MDEAEVSEGTFVARRRHLPVVTEADYAASYMKPVIRAWIEVTVLLAAMLGMELLDDQILSGVLQVARILLMAVTIGCVALSGSVYVMLLSGITGVLAAVLMAWGTPPHTNLVVALAVWCAGIPLVLFQCRRQAKRDDVQAFLQFLALAQTEEDKEEGENPPMR
jgi:hypothetical protein